MNGPVCVVVGAAILLNLAMITMVMGWGVAGLVLAAVIVGLLAGAYWVTRV